MPIDVTGINSAPMCLFHKPKIKRARLYQNYTGKYTKMKLLPDVPMQ
jgi:hypothetical protein